MISADRIIRTLTVGTVIGLGAAAAVVSYDHALTVATENGQHGWTATLTPLTIDGLVLVAGLVLLDGARRGQKARTLTLAYVTLGLGIAATLAVNVLYGIEHGPIGAVVAGWPAVALVLSTELLMGMIRRGQRRAADDKTADMSADTTPAVAVNEGDMSRDIVDADRDTTPAIATSDRDMTADIDRDMSRDTDDDNATSDRDATPDEGDIDRDAEGDMTPDNVTPLHVADEVSRDMTPVRRPRPRVVADADHTERALALLAAEPDIKGAELGRRLGLSERQGQRLLASLRPALQEATS